MDVVIFGTGGFGREVHQLLKDVIMQPVTSAGCTSDLFHFIGFLDGYPENQGKTVHGYPVLGGVEWLSNHRDVGVIVAIGNSVVRRKIVQQVKELCPTAVFPTIIHPSATIGDGVNVGQGTMICAGTIITTDAVIGDYVLLNLDCTIGHDDVIADFVTMAPGVHVSGNVTVGRGTDLGTGCAIIQGVHIGEWSIVGAGSVVIREVPPNVTAVGNPAKVIKQRPPGWYDD